MSLADQLTLFTTCKPFLGEAAQTQENALMTWQALGLPVIICGPEQGAAEAAEKFGARHIPNIELNEKGTPFISSIFSHAEAASTTPWLAYINSDIILTAELVRTLQKALKQLDPTKRTLLSFRRKNIPVNKLLSPERWEQEITETSELYGCWDQSNAIDFFLFSRNLYDNIPPLVVGHMGWDNWLLWRAHEQGAMIIDGSMQSALYHPIHGYSSDGTGLLMRSQGAQAIENRRLTEGKTTNLNDATSHVLQDSTIQALDTQKQRKLKEHCAPDFNREFLAGLKYLKDSFDTRTADEMLDCCRTILWRQKRFYPLLDDNNRDYRNLRFDIVEAYDKGQQGDIRSAALLLEKTVAKAFTERLETLSCNRKIFLWGTGSRGQQLLEFLRQNGIHVEGFLDRDARKVGTKVNDTPIVGNSLEQARVLGEFHVIIASMYAGEIAEEFEQAGLKKLIDYSA
jgi:hypothetical protein